MDFIRLTNLQSAHGDYDYVVETINLVNNFKVEKVIFNCGEYNDYDMLLSQLIGFKFIKYFH